MENTPIDFKPEKHLIPEEILNKCREPFPAEALSTVQSKSYLTSIKAMYVIERLNKVFGVGGWDLDYQIVSDLPEYVTVQGSIIIPAYEFSTVKQFGGHKKTGKGTEPADGYKSAVTDCITKCASFLEIGIDVFKGLVKPQGTKKGYSKENQNQDNRPWLSESQLTAMKEAISQGKGEAVKERMEKYRMKKIYLSELMGLLNNQ